MAPTSYWTIDSKKYYVMWESYQEMSNFPKKTERALSGDAIVFFPNGISWRQFQVTLVILPNMTSDWGTIYDLRTALEKQQSITVISYRDGVDARNTIQAVISDISITEISALASQGYFANLVIQEVAQ